MDDQPCCACSSTYKEWWLEKIGVENLTTKDQCLYCHYCEVDLEDWPCKFCWAVDQGDESFWYPATFAPLEEVDE